MIRVQRSGGECHPDSFPTLVGVTRSSGEATSVWFLFSPPRWGSVHEDTKGGEGTRQWVPSPVLCGGQGVVVLHSLTIAHMSTSSAASRTSAWSCSRSQPRPTSA